MCWNSTFLVPLDGGPSPRKHVGLGKSSTGHSSSTEAHLIRDIQSCVTFIAVQQVHLHMLCSMYRVSSSISHLFHRSEGTPPTSNLPLASGFVYREALCAFLTEAGVLPTLPVSGWHNTPPNGAEAQRDVFLNGTRWYLSVYTIVIIINTSYIQS